MRAGVFLFLGAAAGLAPAGSGASPAAAPADAAKPSLERLFPDRTVARGHGFEIKQSELDEAFTDISAQEASRGRPIPYARRRQVEAEVLDRLIMTKLLVKRATEEDRSVARQKADKALADARSEAISETSFQHRLLAVGATLDEIRTRLIEQHTAEAVIRREVFEKIKLSESDIEKFYRDNPDQFRQRESVRIAHIFLGIRDRLTRRELLESEKLEKRRLAEAVAQRARRGEDFGRLVQEFSEDLPTKDAGGELTIARGQTAPAFELAAFSLGIGQTSDVVATQLGFHVIKLLERRPERQMPLSDVSEAIREQLQRERGRELLQPYFERLKKEAGVTLE